MRHFLFLLMAGIALLSIATSCRKQSFEQRVESTSTSDGQTTVTRTTSRTSSSTSVEGGISSTPTVTTTSAPTFCWDCITTITATSANSSTPFFENSTPQTTHCGTEASFELLKISIPRDNTETAGGITTTTKTNCTKRAS